jgi:hypothetical protein
MTNIYVPYQGVLMPFELLDQIASPKLKAERVPNSIVYDESGIIEDLGKKELSKQEIAVKYGCSASFITRTIKRFNLNS